MRIIGQTVKRITNEILGVTGISLYSSQVTHPARVYPGFNDLKWRGEVGHSTGWDASPLQGNPPSISSGVYDSSLVAIYTPGWREAWGE